MQTKLVSSYPIDGWVHAHQEASNNALLMDSVRSVGMVNLTKMERLFRFRTSWTNKGGLLR